MYDAKVWFNDALSVVFDLADAILAIVTPFVDELANTE